MMVDAVAEFAAQSPASVKAITVCIFQPAMVQEYTDAVGTKVAPSFMQKPAGSDRLL
jgi:hypothetical protein